MRQQPPEKGTDPAADEDLTVRVREQTANALGPEDAFDHDGSAATSAADRESADGLPDAAAVDPE